MNYTPVSLLKNIAEIGEEPLWHRTENVLYFTDIPCGKLWRFDPTDNSATVVHEEDVIGGFTL